MPFDGRPARLEALIKTRAILNTQTDGQQHDFGTCLWHGMHKAGLINARKDKTNEVARALGCDMYAAVRLVSSATVERKRDILAKLIEAENAKRGTLDRVRGAMGELVTVLLLVG